MAFFRRLFLLFSIFIWFTTQPILSQTTDNFPVQTTVFFGGPSSQRLSDWFTSDKRLFVHLRLKDLTKPSLAVYLRWQLDGPGLRIATREGYVPPAFFSLTPGSLSRLNGTDLAAQYFAPALLEAEGLDPQQAYNASLPEGFYTFSVQAFEAATGQVVSNTAQTFLVLSSPQPPILNLPANGTSVPVNALQKVLFQWTPRHFSTPTSQVVYRLKVCRVPDGEEPNEQTLLACTEPVLDQTVPATSLPGDITGWIQPLQTGQRYAVQVQATDLNNQLTNFANQGYSSVQWFHYGRECLPPASFTLQSLTSDRVRLNWETQPQALAYVVEYKAETAADWTSVKVYATTHTVTGLQNKTTYLFRLRSDCGGLLPSAPSEQQSWNISQEAPEAAPEWPKEILQPELISVQTLNTVAVPITTLQELYVNFPTPTANPAGDAPPSDAKAASSLAAANGPVPLTTKLKIPDCALRAGSFADCLPTHPVIPLPAADLKELTTLSVGDVLGIYDFAVFVTKVGDGPGLSGEGLVRLPFLGNALAPVEFKGVKAKKEEGDTNGGCVYEVDPAGLFQLKNDVEARELAERRQALIQALVQKSQPQAFVGTLQQALQRYDLTAKAISEAKQAGQPATPEQRQQLLQFTAAILQGSGALKTQLDALGTENETVTTLLKDLKALTDELQANRGTIEKGTEVPTITDLELKYQSLFERIKQLTTTPMEPPVIPSNARITNVGIGNIDFQSAALTWTGGKTFTKYSILYAADGEGELTQTVTSPQLALKNLKPGRNYTYKIVGYSETGEVLDTYGTGTFSTPARTLPPPENLAYTVQADGSVRITWNKNSLHQRFKLTYKTANGEERTLYPTANSATLTGLDLNQNYQYEVVAFGTNQSVSEPTVGGIFNVICLLSVKAEKTAVVQNESVTLFAFGCDPENLTWSTGKKGTGTLTVSPSISTIYFAVCQIPGKEACSDFVEIKVMPPACENFTINASETEIKQGDRVTLTAQGCSGQLAWNNGLGSEPSISIFPNTTTSFTATCTTGSFFCQRTVTIKVMCKIVLKITPIYEGSLWGLLADKKVKVEAICNNSPLLLNGEKVEGGNFSAKIFDGKNDLTIVASCGEGENACTETVQVKAVTRACRNFKVSGIEDGITLTLNAAGCSEGNSVRWDNGMSGGTITIPLPEKYTVFKAVCGRNGCENYYTYERKNTNELFHIQQKPGNGYPVTLWPVNCKGTVSWESTPTSSLKTDVNQNLIIDSAPAYTTVYTATCTTKDHQVAQRSFTIERPLLCLSVNAPQSIAKGQVATLTAIGCLGTVTWKSSTNTTGIGLSPEGWEKSMIPLGTGQVLTDLPLVNTIYVASCDNPGCLARHIVQIEPCSFTVMATKTTLKAGEETILSAQGCPNGTVLWQDAAGILLGWGNQLSLHPVKNRTIKAICDISKCESTLLINVPPGKPDPIICENLTLTAEPNRPIFRGEPNIVKLTASGCTGGIVTWNGPLLTSDTQTSYPNHTVTIAGLQDAATYSATCTKTALPPTQAGIDIKAEIRFTLKASPEAVEAGKTAVLTAEGCMGGIIAWKNPAVPCAGSPCTITGPVITAPATFEATCVINGQTITKRVNVSLKNSYGSVVYQQVCSSFWASYSAPIQAPYPLSSGLKITFQQGGCEQGMVKWKAQDAEGNLRTLTALEDRPATSTTYTASCETNGAICAQNQFLVEVHQASCQDFEVFVAPMSSSGQLGGAESGKISFIAEYNGKFLITATGCISKDKPGFEQLSVAYYPIAGSPPQSVLNNGSFYAQLNSKVEISCVANPITYPNEVCKYTLYFEKTGIRRENNSNARIGDIANAESAQTQNTGNAAAASGCTAVLPLKNLMADYFATLLCANINAFYDEYGQFSTEKTAAFLTAAENQLRNDPAFNSYTLDFPEDFSDIVDRIEALEGDCEGMAEIAQRLTAEMKGTMPADTYNEAAAKSYPAVEAAAREELAPEDHVPKPASIKLTTNATENKCIPIAVLIYTLKSSILYKHNLQLHDLPEKCLTTQESNVIVNPAINEMTLPLVKVRFSESFLADGLTITTPTLVALVDPNDAKRVVIMRGSLPLLVFALDTEYNAQRLADYFGVAPVKPPVTATFPITGAQLKEIFSTTDQSRCDEVAELINKYSDKFEINTPLRMAHFLGQVGIESARFEAFGEKTGENPCYKKTNIAWKHSAGRAGWIANKTWIETPISEGCDDYTGDKKKKRKHPNWDTVEDVPNKYICSKSNPSISGKALLSYVYRCEGGNGDEASQDGFRYRGHGVMQLTWKKQYVEFDNWLQGQGFEENYKKVVSDPDSAFADPDIDMLSAMWFWNNNQCNDAAEKLKKGCTQIEFEVITKKINKSKLENDKRWEIFNNSFDLLTK